MDSELYLFNEVGLVGIVFELVVWLQVEDHIERLSIMRNLLIQASQVEFVLDVVLIDLQKFCS